MTALFDEATLRAGASALGCPLNDEQVARVGGYLDLLARWNRTYNLTAIRDPKEMLVQHALDSLALVSPLVRHTGGRPIRLLDVGSGGGLPGVILAIARPETEVVCIDAVAKKASFVQQVAAELRLTNLSATHGRVETLHSGPFDVITSRAFASLDDFTRLTAHLLAQSGVWVAMKGQHPTAELAALPAGIAVFHVEPLTVPGLVAERCLVWMRPAQ